MLFVLSPAKTLDYATPLAPGVEALATRPAFVAQAAALIEVLRALTPAEVASLMDLSDPLAQLNVARYAAWRSRFTPHNSRPTALAFAGDVYEGLQAATLRLDELRWAQQHLAILSGLYGVLRPLDRLQPYRLEMGTRLATPGAKDLYGYWGTQLAEHLNAWQSREKAPVLVNLASQEYFKALPRKALRARVVDCQFEDWSAGQWKVVSFFAKRARGMMARFAIQHRLDQVSQLRDFDTDGYVFDQGVSSENRLVFRRR
ncbi:MAG: peroxide stress protein YaaA [Burkholderiales bacterium]|nr:peroxide stress protein YaaA [Burkholderiales bacterium]